jgi:hypothetical protein
VSGHDLLLEPPISEWSALAVAARRRDARVLGRPLRDWRVEARAQLGLDRERPVIATGHQTLLWHPGILAKYLAVGAVAAAEPIATANLIVDQHADGFGAFEVPVRDHDGALAARRIEFTRSRPGVPMALHEPFTPSRAPAHFSSALPEVTAGVQHIFAAIADHANAANAAMQMAAVLDDLMARWVRPMPPMPATRLMTTSFGRALVAACARDPRACAAAYNRAVTALPEARIEPLAVDREAVELPLWRVGPDGIRCRAFDHDADAWLDAGAAPAMLLMPRALFMTALVRLVACDLFVHGTGGASYDRAMERWIRDWLGAAPAPIAVASATLRLPLGAAGSAGTVAEARRALRRWRHDPEAPPDDRRPGPGPAKRALLAAIDAQPRGSAARRAAFHAMHGRLDEWRRGAAADLDALEARVRDAERDVRDRAIAARRDWPFPLYSTGSIDALAREIAAGVRRSEAPSAP